MKFIKFILFKSLVTVVSLSAFGLANSQTILRASHQFPGSTGDVRDEMIRMIAQEVEAANVDLVIRVYPGQSLFKATDQWSALTRGRLDIALLPLDYASGRHPEFSATLMPGLVKNHEHARRLNDSPFMADIKSVINSAGARVLADTWLAGGFTSSEQCILSPTDIEGQVIRAAGPAFERMMVAAGASITSMPSSEIYTAMQTGVLDAASTSSASFVTFRLHEHSTCLTAPGEHGLWFMYEPVLIGQRTWDRLNTEQQNALIRAGQNAEEYFFEQAQLLDTHLEEVFREAGVSVVHMTEDQANEWRSIAAETSYKVFAEEVSGGAELIQKALLVE
ncbi:MAG: ABC transporter substrate-binding protein [Rhodospirillaceae bacterium]|nr:ABC transporter substrate-binding protein [Rhodospirillaceae bacterium]